jgi:hypothetical protein
MTNFVELEKSKGVLYFVFDTKEFKYSEIAKTNVQLINHFLKLPVTVVTDSETPIDFAVDRVIRLDTSNEVINTRYSSTHRTRTQWRNGFRHQSYQLSPYTETYVIDVDYVVLNDNLLKLPVQDYCLYKSNVYLNNSDAHETMGIYSLPFLWATVLFFKKCPRTELMFGLVERIQSNYNYYRALYNIPDPAFRNDYAFAIADNIVEGYADSVKHIPWSLTTVDNTVSSIEVKGSKVYVKQHNTAHVLPMMDLHILDKVYLQSTQHKDFVTSILNA